LFFYYLINVRIGRSTCIPLDGWLEVVTFENNTLEGLDSLPENSPSLFIYNIYGNANNWRPANIITWNNKYQHSQNNPLSYKSISFLNTFFTQYSENEYFYNLTGNKIAEYDGAKNNIYDVNSYFKKVSGYLNGVLYVENANAVNLINITYEDNYANEYEPSSSMLTLSNLINEVYISDSLFKNNNLKDVRVMSNKLPTDIISIKNVMFLNERK